MKHYKQHDSQDCGVACLRTVFSGFNIHSTFPILREVTKISKNGTTMFNMIEASKLYGLNAEGLEGSINDLIFGITNGELNLPMIAHTINNSGLHHYVIVEKIKNKSFIIFDPAEGKKKMSFKTFEQIWSGYIINFTDQLKPQIIENNKSKYLLYKEIIKKNKFYFFFIVFLLVFVYLFSLIIPFVIKELIDFNVSGKHNFFSHFNIFQIILAFITVIIVQFFMNILCSKIIQKKAIQINQIIISKYFNRLLSLPLNFFRNISTGDIITRLADLNDLVIYISFTLPNILSDGIIIVIMAAMLYKINMTMFNLVLCIVFMYFLVLLFFKNKLQYAHIRVRKGSSILNSKLKEYIDSIETIKSLVKEETFLEKLQEENNELMSRNYTLQMCASYLNSTIMSIELIGILILMVVGINLVAQNLMTLGTLVMFESLFYLFITPIKNIIESMSEAVKSLNSIDRLSDIIDSSIETNTSYLSKEKKINLEFKKIELSDVQFTYNEATHTLNNINITLSEGTHYGIAGSSGSGKSTLMKLITLLETANSGSIYVDGVNINDIPLELIRNNILYVSQNISLFNDTLYENLVVGKKIVDKEQLESVLNGCHINDIIQELGIDLNYVISENGFNLSGGQRQLIAVARALLCNPHFIIFDESFNQMNYELAQSVLSFINSKFKKTTIIQVTHDKSILKYTDEVINL